MAARRRGRVAALLAAAGLVAALGIGTVSAGQAGGPLYDLRLHAETLLLPADPPQRAVAEVARLQTRLAEAAAARLRGDMPAMRAALSAYAEIVDHAATAAILAGDPIGSAALEAGVARNVVVLRALLEDSPDAAASGLSRALERSDAAIDGIPGGDGNGGGAPASPERPDRTERPSDTPTPRQTAEPTPDLTPEPATSPTPERSPKPTKTPTATPTETPEPMPTPTATPALTPMPTPVSEPERSQRPGRTPPGRPSDVPGQQGKESSPGA